MSVVWSESGLLKIKDLKKSILKKKIMLSFIIDNYAWWDKAFRWTHIGLAILTPILTTVQDTIQGANGSSTASIIIGFIVAGMLKLKDYVTYDKVRETAKEQTVKYRQLYETIESPQTSHKKYHNEEEFINWVTESYNHICLTDPELSHSEKKKFIKFCRDKGIQYDEDLEALENLLGTPNDSNKPSENLGVPNMPVQIPVQIPSNQPSENIDRSNMQSNYPSVQPPNKVEIVVHSINESDCKVFKDTVKNMNTTAEADWTFSRFSSLDP